MGGRVVETKQGTAMREWKPGLLTTFVVNQIWKVLKEESKHLERDPFPRVIMYCRQG